MRHYFPTTETVQAGPTGIVATASDLASVPGRDRGRGERDGAARPDDRERERPDRASPWDTRFRARTFRLEIPEGNRCLAIWLPWGPASTVTVTVDGSAFTDFETQRRYRHVDFVVGGHGRGVPESSGTWALRAATRRSSHWRSTGWPPTLWNMPGADGLTGAYAGRERASLVSTTLVRTGSDGRPDPAQGAEAGGSAAQRVHEALRVRGDPPGHPAADRRERGPAPHRRDDLHRQPRGRPALRGRVDHAARISRSWGWSPWRRGSARTG